jgi:hypothetical protein
MTRYLTILGAALAVVAAWAALPRADAGAVKEETTSAYYKMTGVEAEETAAIDGEQMGAPAILVIGGLAPLTCFSVKYNGEFGNSGSASDEPMTIRPEYGSCHVFSALGTRTVTVTMNGCTYQIEPTATRTESEQEHFLGQTDIVCPEGKVIEVHVFNTGIPTHEGASTLCTFDIPAQSNLPGVTFTNKINTPISVDDLVADFNLGAIKVTKTTGSEPNCGPPEPVAFYKGEATLRATNEVGEFVNAQIGNPKTFTLGRKAGAVIGDENGTAKLKTEKKELNCTISKYEATPAGETVVELSFKPTYTSCTFGTLTTHADFKSCKYLYTILPELHTGPFTTANFKITCNSGDKITFTATNAKNEATCTITYGEQGPMTEVQVKNKTGAKKTDAYTWYIVLTHKISTLEYEISGDPATCGKNEKLKGGTLEGAIDIRAYEKADKKVQKGIRVFGLRAHDAKS